MEGAIFYWVYWLYWVYLTFIMEKHHPLRLKLAVIILLIIIFSETHFAAGRVDLYGGGLLLLMFSYLFMRKEKLGVIIYMAICSLIISIAYVTFHLFEIFDPIWIIFNENWMIAICMWYLAILLQKSLKGRLIMIIIGTMQGEILYAIFLSKYQFPYQIGGPPYLDICALITVLLVAWNILENTTAILETHFQFLTKLKQKSSGN